MWYNESDPALMRSPGQHHNPPTRKGAAMPGESSKKIELARRAVACKRWRWMPGMLISGLGRVVAYRVTDGWPEIDVTDGTDVWRYRGYKEALLGPSSPGAAVRHVDLDDAATIGCLLALVREAWGSDYVFVHPPSRLDLWMVLRPDEGVWGQIVQRDTELEALVAALEAAPG